MKSGRNELQEEREGNKGEIEYATFSNYDAANEIRVIKAYAGLTQRYI
jgi:hypothetical protein